MTRFEAYYIGACVQIFIALLLSVLSGIPGWNAWMTFGLWFTVLASVGYWVKSKDLAGESMLTRKDDD
jgi:uncharacterized membrane protein YGL010W